jgi:hypothetical protein
MLKLLIFCLLSLTALGSFADNVSVIVNGNTYSCSGDSSQSVECSCTFTTNGILDSEGYDTSCMVDLQLFNKALSSITKISSFKVKNSQISACGKAPLSAVESETLTECQITLKTHPFCN